MTTNLPTLPDDKNLFWRVAEVFSNSYVLWGPALPNGVAIQIVEKYEELEDKFKKNGKPRRLPLKTVIKERVLHQHRLVREEKYDETVYDDERNKIGVKEKTKFVDLGKGDLTPELILAAAEIALARYLEIVESEKLLGDYPPKTLPDSKKKVKKTA